MDTMTPDRLAEIRARVEAATRTSHTRTLWTIATEDAPALLADRDALQAKVDAAAKVVEAARLWSSIADDYGLASHRATLALRDALTALGGARGEGGGSMRRPEIQHYPVRRCRTMHECFRCKGTIHYGQDYYDGGYGYRAHVICPTRLGDANPPPHQPPVEEGL